MKPYLHLFSLFITIATSSLMYAATSAAGTTQALIAEQQALPGIQPDPQLQQQLQQAFARKGQRYNPRSEHLLANGQPRYINRLILEESPYLLQHAHNPVNWFPWGKEALAVAKREHKPIFLSIGYSTCHWCHVMERESFDNPDIARFLNEHFIAIKVDREQRPDIDATYMSAVRLMSGQGGWPMSSFLTPQGKPFFGGTYFSPEHFSNILQRINRLWSANNDELLQKAERISEAVARVNRWRGKAGSVDSSTLERAADTIMEEYDELQGGFSTAPKFPNEAPLLFLLQRLERQDNEELRSALLHTLDAMARGGIHDQIGGGFHRYATDHAWRIPHFEKMLYNQALLARVYLKAWQLTGEPRHARTVRQTLDYVLRDMRSDKGGFYSATDADSEGQEGRFFLWNEEQIKQALHPAAAAHAIALFGVTREGNFEGGNILYLPVSLQQYAADHNLPLSRLTTALDAIRAALYSTRNKRTPPGRDEKIITAWNGMLITTLALAGEALQEPRYLQAAERAANFLWQHNRRGVNGLWRSHLQGNSSIVASQEDYAWYGEALITLYDITREALWLQRAQIMAEGMLKRFLDHEQGGLFMSEAGVALGSMPRIKDIVDSAIPSGNSAGLRFLSMLDRRTGNPVYAAQADALLAAFASTIAQQPAACSYLLLAADEYMHGETGPHRYTAQGVVAAHAVMDRGARGTITLRIKPGWHINAHKPLQEYLKPTRLEMARENSDWTLEEIRYPKPVHRTLGFSTGPLALYEGDMVINVRLQQRHHAAGDGPAGTGRDPVVLRLSLQSCSDQTCLAPEVLEFRLTPPRTVE